jgi:hypothetical protein
VTLPRLPSILALVFAAAYTQPPHFYSNQHQYLLHGLAQAGYGNLADDWLANTTDPTPFFSAGIALGYRVGEWTFQLVQFVAIAVYFLSVWKLVDAVGLMPRTLGGKLLFAGLFTLSHSAILRVASVWLLGADYPWFLQAGVANQYLLGAGLQPSVVGVLLVTALAAYASGRPMLACGLAAAVNLIHATYLLPSAMLVAGMSVGEWRAGRSGSAVRAAGLALLVAGPIAAYQFITFGPTGDHSDFDYAQWIIANERIPHHARPARWFDAAAGFQIAWIGIGLVVLRRTKLVFPLAVATVLALATTAAVLATKHPTLELLFPWRVTAVLVPVATAGVLATVVQLAEQLPGRNRPVQTGGLIGSLSPWGEGGRRPGEGGGAPSRAAPPPSPGSQNLATLSPRGEGKNLSGYLGILLLAVSVLGAGSVYFFGLGYREPTAADAVLDYVRRSKQKGDVYLTPTRFAKPTTERGVYSFTFVPPKDVVSPLSFELSSFRLTTGAAQYVDFKSIPYKDVEVLEWQRRVANGVRWFANPDWDTTGMSDVVAKEGVTHVVAPAELGLRSKRLDPVAEAGEYRIYLIRP